MIDIVIFVYNYYKNNYLESIAYLRTFLFVYLIILINLLSLCSLLLKIIRTFELFYFISLILLFPLIVCIIFFRTCFKEYYLQCQEVKDIAKTRTLTVSIIILTLVIFLIAMMLVIKIQRR